MFAKFALPAALVAVAVAAAPAAEVTTGMKAGTPTLKSISNITFGPDGVLFLGDPTAATIYAVATNDTKPAGKAEVKLDKVADKIGSLLGVPAAQIAISDVKVNPASGNVYLAVTRGKGMAAAPLVMKLARDGSLTEFAMKDVSFSSVALPNASDKTRQEAITGMAFVAGKLIVAGLSNEEFASTLRSIPFPFAAADKGTAVEIYHGAHGKFETQAPVRTLTTYKIGAADYVLAAYLCTPLVTIPLSDLKPGTKVKGTTIAELGNRNRPLDIIVYNKDGKDYVLMSNNARGVMKIAADGFGTAEPITTRVQNTAGVKYETVKELVGVQQLDKLDDARAVLLVKAENGDLNLVTVMLP